MRQWAMDDGHGQTKIKTNTFQLQATSVGNWVVVNGPWAIAIDQN